MGKIKCSLCLKKNQANMLIFAPKIALRVECSDPACSATATTSYPASLSNPPNGCQGHPRRRRTARRLPNRIQIMFWRAAIFIQLLA